MQIKDQIDTLQPLYKTVHYNMVLDITLFKDDPKKCRDYIEKWPLMVIFQYNLYIFIPRHPIVAGYYGFTLDVCVSVCPSVCPS